MNSKNHIMIKKIFKRFVYDNFFRRSRLPLYEHLLSDLVESGYRFIPICEYWDLLKNNKLEKDNKYCILRHDVDTDPNTAYKMFGIETKYGIRSTYYYRWYTLRQEHLKELMDYGTEVGYHYEELSSYAKKKRIKSKEEIEKNINIIQSDFIDNFNRFRRITGYCKTCASHGDWVNAHYLHIQNHYLMDKRLKQILGIEVEAYDKELVDQFECDIADLGNDGNMWVRIENGNASHFDISKIFNYKIIEILVHPRNWKSNLWWNAKTDIIRLVETIRYNL